MTQLQQAKTLIDVIIPVRNEEATVERLLAEVEQALAAESVQVRFICVDDGSTDGSWEVLERQSSHRNGRFLGVRLSRGFGKDAALLAGLRESSGDAVVTMDADCQHPPALLPALLQKWREGAHVVNGQKQAQGHDGFARRLLRKQYNRFFSWLSGFDFEGASDYKLLDRQVVKALTCCDERHFFYRGIIPWLGFHQEHLLFEVGKSPRKSRWNLFQLCRMALNSLILYSDLILYVFMLIGGVMFVLSSAVFLKLLYTFLFASVPQGYATIVSLLLITVTLNICTVAILGLFAKRNLDETVRRPSFVTWRQAGRLYDGSTGERDQ